MTVELIKSIKSEITGEIVEKSKVIDHLLDLRLLSKDDMVMAQKIDHYLGVVPGASSVAAKWFDFALSDLLQIEATAVAHIDLVELETV